MSESLADLLARMRVDELRGLLRSLREPCFESQMLHAAFPDLDILHASPLDLYRHHFALFHVLYKLQAEFRSVGLHLHVHFMRTSLAPLPPPGACRYFEEDRGVFCGASAGVETGVCELHADLFGEAALDRLSDRFFYADTSNYDALDEESAGAFLNGTWEVFAGRDSLLQAFRTLDLAPTSDRKVIRRRFADLARDHHPDAGATSAARFCEINAAYRLIIRLIAAFEPHQKGKSERDD